MKKLTQFYSRPVATDHPFVPVEVELKSGFRISGPRLTPRDAQVKVEHLQRAYPDREWQFRQYSQA
jgi:hypothetical protein